MTQQILHTIASGVVVDDERTGPPKSGTELANHDLDTTIKAVGHFRDAGLDRPTVAEITEFMEKAGIAHRASYKNQLYSAAKYRLIEFRKNTAKLNEVFLLPLGEEALDAQLARQARVRAFLSVALNRGLYARFHDRILPAPDEIERVMGEDFGITEGQRQNGRQTFMRSAEQAGFFEQGRDRLRIPADVPLPPDLASEIIPAEGKEDMAQQETDTSPASVHADAVPPVTAPEGPLARPEDVVVSPGQEVPAQVVMRHPGLTQGILDYWLERQPRIDAPKEKWTTWLGFLSLALDLGADD